MRSLYSLILLLISHLPTISQNLNDISGEWRGTSSFLKTDYKVSASITQIGSQLEGFVSTYSMNEKDSIKVRFNGGIDGDMITLHPVEVIYKTGLMCASVLSLRYSAAQQYRLEGKWKGDFSLNTCAPGTGGKIQLYKIREHEKLTQPIQAPISVAPVAEEDDLGKALVNELSNRKYYALIIGINDYEDEKIQSLDNPIADGIKLAQVLSDAYSFDKSEMMVLKNPKREEIIEALDMLSQKVTEKDNLLIFYAGHGIWNEQLNQGYWLPSDAAMDAKSYWISNSTIRDYVGGIRSKHTLLISDACFSGGILKERAVFNNSRAILELYKLPSRKAMTSGTMKTVPDQSVFIEYLVKSLQNNTAPLLSADQLFRNFKIAVINNSPNGQVPQYGPIVQAGDEGGDFIFLRSQ